MIYYIEYSREQQKTLSFKSYQESDRMLAEAHALKREIELSRQNLQLEIVLLQAGSESTIRNTHPRYFGNPIGAEMRDVWLNMPTQSTKMNLRLQARAEALPA
jgi:hypothetical protein